MGEIYKSLALKWDTYHFKWPIKITKTCTVLGTNFANTTPITFYWLFRANKLMQFQYKYNFDTSKIAYFGWLNNVLSRHLVNSWTEAA